MAVVTARATRVRAPRLKHIVLLVYLLLAVVVMYTRDIQLLDPHSFLRQREHRCPSGQGARRVTRVSVGRVGGPEGDGGRQPG